MCGIAGMMTRNGALPNDNVIELMMRYLEHRGPDGAHHALEDGCVLIHARLAIMDPKGGDQPLYHPSKRYILIANGEIYNSPELRQQFPDYPFKTGSDMEVILPLYEKYGEECVTYLRGMFAFAIYDTYQRRLCLARDPFGIKPLYVAQNDEAIYFASESVVLTKSGLVPPRVNEKARKEVLQMQFSCGRKTLFQNIERVLPGEVIHVEEGQIVDRKTLMPRISAAFHNMTEQQALEGFDDVMRKSVALHQRSDVEYGLFLSGGVDSSVLLNLMTPFAKKKLKTYTIGFHSHAHNEAGQAKKLATLKNSNHHEILFDKKDFWRLLPKAVKSADDAVIDYALLPTLKLAETASEHLKVVLCGEGGDELFGGYGRYRRALRPHLLGGRKMRSKGVFDKTDFLDIDLSGWRDDMASYEKALKSENLDNLQKLQLTDMKDWLSHGLLTKLDRCLMREGIEGRTPFLDKEVFDFAFHLPKSLKIKKRIGKHIPKTWLQQHMPQAEPFAKKRGFTVPVGIWLWDGVDRLRDILIDSKGLHEIMARHKIETLLAKQDKSQTGILWFLTFYALWHAYHIEGIDISEI